MDNVMVSQREDGSLAIVPFQVDGVDSGATGELSTRSALLVVRQIAALGHDVDLSTPRCWGVVPAGEHSLEEIEAMMRFLPGADFDY